MKMEVIVNVTDVLEALQIDGLAPTRVTDTIEISAEVDDDDIKDKAPEPDPIELHDELDQTTVMDLAAAIRRGDTAEAELMLDRLVGDDTVVRDWIQMGRFSRKARPEAIAA